MCIRDRSIGVPDQQLPPSLRVGRAFQTAAGGDNAGPRNARWSHDGEVVKEGPHAGLGGFLGVPSVGF
eukprot:13239911-Alexandrium_andersonii.AAC.1